LTRISEKTFSSSPGKALILNSPSNPTGQVYTRNELEEIASLALKHNFYLISDEVYEKIIYDGREHFSIASLGEEIKDLTIVVNAVSKTYAMTGWRIGYTASNQKIASAMADIQSHAASNPNSIAQKAATVAISGPQECIEEMRQSFEKRKDYMYQFINNLPLVSCMEPHGAFYAFVDIKETFTRNFRGIRVENGNNFAELLLEHYTVAVVPGDGFGAPDYIRLSYATAMENMVTGLERLKSFLSELI